MPRISITVPDMVAQPYRFKLDRKAVTLGRGSDNDIVIDCSSVSVAHAVMERVKGGYQIRDLGSTNGTKLDGTPRDKIALTNGSSVKLGDVAFDFTLTEEEEAVLRSELPGEESPVVKETPGETPPPETPPRKARERVDSPPRPPSALASCVMAVLLVIFAIISFVAGMSIRYQKDTGRSGMIHDFLHRVPSEEAKPVPSADDPPEVLPETGE